MIRTAVLTIAAACSLSSAQPAAPHYHYFDQPRILIEQTDTFAIIGSAPDQGLLDLIDPHAHASPIGVGDAWIIKATPRSPADYRRVVARAAKLASPRDHFISPVFLGDDGGPIIVTRDILVRFHADTPQNMVEQLLAAAGTVLDRDWGGMTGAYRVRSHASNGYQVLIAANTLARRNETEFAEPDMIFTGRSGTIPNDPLFPSVWGVHNIGQPIFGVAGLPDIDMNGPEAWDTTFGDPSIITVVIDTGVDPIHPDLNQVPGTDTISEGDGSPQNACDNHGTPVAGCIAAIANNNLGTVGIAPGTRIASARAFISNLSCNGSWTSNSSATVNALAFAESIGARVTNNSNGYGFTSSAIASKYNSTRNAGILHFASAGNGSSTFGPTYPASLPTVIAVSAINNLGDIAGFSNTGNGIGLAAPGVDVLTTDRSGADGWVNGDYVFAWGTSFASPYSAGVAALIFSIDPSLTAFEALDIIFATAKDRGPAGYDTSYGWGIPDAAAAIYSLNTCPADLTGDGILDFFDVSAFLTLYANGTGTPALPPSGADFNNDGILDFFDVSAFLNLFADGCS